MSLDVEILLSGVLESYPILAPVIFIIVRAIPIIIPPIPGIVVDYVGIAVFGWVYGLVLAGSGVMLGSSVGFFIARYFRESLYRRFKTIRKLNEWEKRFSEKEKFLSLVLLRFLTSPLFDWIAFAAGLSRMKFSTFFWSTFFSAMPIGFVIYYFGGLSFAQGPIGIVLFVVATVLSGVLIKFTMKEGGVKNSKNSQKSSDKDVNK